MSTSYITVLKNKLSELEGLQHQQKQLLSAKTATFADAKGKNILTVRKNGIGAYVDVMNIHLKESIEALALELKEKFGVDLDGEL